MSEATAPHVLAFGDSLAAGYGLPLGDDVLPPLWSAVAGGPADLGSIAAAITYSIRRSRQDFMMLA